MVELLEVTPDELCFTPPLDKVIACILRLRNTTGDSIVAFKVKTTAPKRYCVRPNSGYVNPGENVEVQILLQPVPDHAPTDTRSRDKFLVQSMKITPQQTGHQASIWPSAEKMKANKGLVHEVKLRCFFQSPEARAAERAKVAGNAAALSGVSPRSDDPGAAPVTARGAIGMVGGSHPPMESVTIGGNSNAGPSNNSSNVDVGDLMRRLSDAENTVVAVSKDRDQLHDTLEEAASKLEELQNTKKTLEAKAADQASEIERVKKDLASAKSSAQLSSSSSSSKSDEKSSGFSLIFLIAMCLAFLAIGIAMGAAYGDVILPMAGAGASAAAGGAGKAARKAAKKMNGAGN